MLCSHLLQELPELTVGGQDFGGAWTASAEWSQALSWRKPARRGCKSLALRRCCYSAPPPPPTPAKQLKGHKRGFESDNKNDLHASPFWQADKWLEGATEDLLSQPLTVMLQGPIRLTGPDMRPHCDHYNNTEPTRLEQSMKNKRLR